MEMEMETAAIRRLVEESARIVFFGGAGTSTESGIPDFRSQSGLFRTESGMEHPPEEVLSRDFFMTHPAEFYRFYREKLIHPDAVPNDGHKALAGLEAAGKLTALVTQNIDGLHQLAGSRNVLELHGSIHRNYCMQCGAFHSLDAVMKPDRAVPVCDGCGGTIKPDVVLYRERLDDAVFAAAGQAIAEADMLIVAGTSLSVYPAAGLVRHYRGNRLLLINRTATGFDKHADYIVREPFAVVMSPFL